MQPFEVPPQGERVLLPELATDREGGSPASAPGESAWRRAGLGQEERGFRGLQADQPDWRADRAVV
jgi:hypothetical protein